MTRAGASYCCNRSRNELPLNQALKDSSTLDENVLLEDGKVGVDISPPDFRFAGTRRVGSQGVVDEAGLGDIGVVEQGRSHLAIKRFIGANKSLGRRVVNKSSRNVRQVFIPFGSVSMERKCRKRELPFVLDKVGFELRLDKWRFRLHKPGREFYHRRRKWGTSK
jgi:hypothetical protein